MQRVIETKKIEETTRKIPDPMEKNRALDKLEVPQ
jgi:hypothetical protein